MLLKNLKQLYFKIKYWFFSPLHLFIIKTKCPLWGKCDDNIQISIITMHNDYYLEDILNNCFKAIGRHLYDKHNVNFFAGLDFKTERGKFSIYGDAPTCPNKQLKDIK